MNNHYAQSQRGAALLLFILFFLFGSVSLTYVLSIGIYRDIAQARVLLQSKQSYLTAESLTEDISYRYISNKTVDLVESLSLGGAVAAATTTYDGVQDEYTTIARGVLAEAVRTNQIVIRVTNGVSFNYGMQSGQGGIEMNNSSSIRGNVYSNGTVVGAGNTIAGDVIVAGPTGLLDGIHATGSVWANTINNAFIEGDAHYQSINLTNSTVWGTLNPGAADPAPAPFPISDEVIFGWEAEAEAGGVYSGPCPYILDVNATLGPLKIPCDFEIKKNGTVVTLQGPVWVTGDFKTTNGPDIVIDSSLADTIVPIVVDNPSNRVTSSRVDISNSTVFTGAAGVSHILVVSMNEDDEVNGGSEVAIWGGQSSAGDIILYAPHGRARVSNSGTFTELTAYTIELNNSVQVIFDTGLANPNFTGGPSASYSFADWSETQ